MRVGRLLEAGGRVVFSVQGAAALTAALFLMLAGLSLTGHRQAFVIVMAAGAAGIATVWAAVGYLQRERVRSDIASRTEEARERAMLHDELDHRLVVQKQLRESDARLHAIVESAPLALFATNLDGVITFSAGVGPDPLGKKAGEAAGWSAFELFADHEKLLERLRGALSGSTSQIDLALGERVFSLRLAPFRDAGKTVGAIVVAVDITDQQHAEVALRRTVEMLKQVDADRRALLTRLVNAQEEERRRIAADIHDDSVQAMFAVGVRLLTLGSTLRDPTQIELVNRLQDTVQQASDRLRHLVFELRPATLDEGGLGSALREYLEVMKDESGIQVELGSTLAPQPASEVEVIAYRIALEALANVRKHSRATRVHCDVTIVDGGIRTRIRDDGVGFSAGDTGPRPGHVGLVAMRERAELAGGWLRLDSAPGKGCTVEYWIPTANAEVARAA